MEVKFKFNLVKMFWKLVLVAVVFGVGWIVSENKEIENSYEA